MPLEELFLKAPLIPVIVQHTETLEVLMLGYADLQALRNTIGSGTAWFFSRSRNKLWNKGETSGHFLTVDEIVADCDLDTLIYRARPVGPTCHTGQRSCFFQTIWRRDDADLSTPVRDD